MPDMPFFRLVSDHLPETDRPGVGPLIDSDRLVFAPALRARWDGPAAATEMPGVAMVLPFGGARATPAGAAAAIAPGAATATTSSAATAAMTNASTTAIPDAATITHGPATATTNAARATMTNAARATGTTTTTATMPDTAAAKAAPDLPSFAWRLGNDWGTGFTAYIDITNTTGNVIEDFAILIAAPGFAVTNIWGGTAETLANGDILITGVSWTTNLAPGQSVSLGFNGAGRPPAGEALRYSVVIDGQTHVIGAEPPGQPGEDQTGGGTGTPTGDPDDGPQDEEQNGGQNGGQDGGTDEEQDGDQNGNSPDDPGGADTGPLPGFTWRLENTWGTGFTAHVDISNDTDRVVQDFVILISAPDFAVSNIWGGQAETLANGDIRITGLSWTRDIGAGQDVSLGFNGAGSPPDLSALSFAAVIDGVTHAVVEGAGPGDGSNGDTPDGGDGDTGGQAGGDEGGDDTGGDTGNNTGGNTGGDPDDPNDPGDQTGDQTGDTDSSATPFDAGDYGTALSLSMEFYYAQYSGDLPDDFPLDWRGDSALQDGADVGADLTGGWYDAGDHVKFGLPMAFSATMLAWGAADYTEGYAAAGALDDLLTHLDWVTDYFLRAYDDKGTADLSDDVFHAQVGDGHADHAWWGAPEDMTMDRPTYSVTADAPGTEVTAETAAALASAAIVFRQAGQTAQADRLLDTAIQLYDFAETYQGSYADAIPEVRSFYNSYSGFQDELAWGAAWLYEATGDAAYLARAEAHYPGGSTGWTLGWDDKSNGVAMMLAEATGDARYLADIDAHLEHMMTGLTRTPGTETNAGLAWLDQWGSNRYASNMAFLAVERASLADARGETALAARLRDFASDQIDYMLGDNPDGQSYLVGFGEDYPLNPHHRAASGTTDVHDPADNLYTLTGALVGGPDANGAYSDTRNDYVQNEVATDYNAGFSGALAGLIAFDLG